MERGNPAPYDPLYLKGIEFFNRGEFFEAHETWEALWHKHHHRGQTADFLKGLIQAAVSLHHFREGNLKGAWSLYQSCLLLLRSCGNQYMGLNLQEFLSCLDDCFGNMEPYSMKGLPGREEPSSLKNQIAFPKEKVPYIKLLQEG